MNMRGTNTTRDLDRLKLFDPLRQDFRYGWRGLVRRPALTLTVLFTLAPGIAVVTTFFSFLNSALFRPLPYTDSERIVALSAERRGSYAPFSQLPSESVTEIRQTVGTFERIAAYRDRPARLALPNDVIQLQVTEVDSELLGLLGIRPRLGRLFTANEIRRHDPVVLVSDSLWRTHLGEAGDIGQSIRIDGMAYSIIGVMPKGFRFSERSDIWTPLTLASADNGTTDHFVSALGKLREGVSVQRARRDVDLVGRRLAAAEPARYAGWTFVVRDGMVDRGTRAWRFYAALLVSGAICVLLVACSNVANLLLARAAERHGEMAIRASLGASRARLLWQNLNESLLLALMSGAAGLLLSIWGVRFVTTIVPTAGFPSWVRFGVDLRVVAFAFGISLLTIIAFGLLPALEATRIDLATALRAGGEQGVVGRPPTSRGRGIVVAELAISVVLFLAASLLASTYRNLTNVHRGYDEDRVLRVFVALDPLRYATPAARTEFHHDLRERVRTHPGIEHSALRGVFAGLHADSVAENGEPRRGSGRKFEQPGSERLTTGSIDHGIYLRADPTSSATRGLRPQPTIHVVSDDYFRVLGLPLLRGRSFGRADHAGSVPVVILSERLERHLWRGETSLARELRVGRQGAELTVIGIVRDVRAPGLGARGATADALPDLYVSERQAAMWNPELLVRASCKSVPTGRPDPHDCKLAELKAALRTVVRAIDANQVVFPIRTLADERATDLLPIKLLGGIIVAFAVAALALALVGVYGVIAYGVVARTREIGVRMALGAKGTDILQLVVREGVRLTGTGLVVGLVAAQIVTRSITRLLWGASPTDLTLHAIVVVVFASVALAASLIPARRAIRLTPLHALRAESRSQ